MTAGSCAARSSGASPTHCPTRLPIGRTSTTRSSTSWSAQPRYFFDLDAIREPHRSGSWSKRADSNRQKTPRWAGPLADGSQDGLRRARPEGQPGHPLGKNPGSVWEIPTYGFRGPHFATFPPRLVRRPILSTCPEAICTRCGRPWRRRVSVKRIPVGQSSRRRSRRTGR